MLETRNGQIDRRRQIIDNQLLGDVAFDCSEYLLYPVIHRLTTEEKERTAKIAKARTVIFSFQKVMTFFAKTLQNYFLSEKNL
jgi:hypothetical protein